MARLAAMPSPSNIADRPQFDATKETTDYLSVATGETASSSGGTETPGHQLEQRCYAIIAR
jgi:hypothetical protein